jgi:alkaline phosphatase D
MYDAIKASNSNAVIVSGDSHAFWVNQLYDAGGQTRVAAEFGTSSVTSPSPGDYVPGIDLGKIFVQQNHEVVFCDQTRKGYTVLTITPESVVGELVTTETLMRPYRSSSLAKFRVEPTPAPGIGEIQKI